MRYYDDYERQGCEAKVEGIGCKRHRSCGCQSEAPVPSPPICSSPICNKKQQGLPRQSLHIFEMISDRKCRFIWHSLVFLLEQFKVLHIFFDSFFVSLDWQQGFPFAHNDHTGDFFEARSPCRRIDGCI